jgi:hypothetical protein
VETTDDGHKIALHLFLPHHPFLDPSPESNSELGKGRIRDGYNEIRGPVMKTFIREPTIGGGGGKVTGMEKGLTAALRDMSDWFVGHVRRPLSCSASPTFSDSFLETGAVM